MPQFYDGTKLLSLNDINNRKPSIYISTSNRSAGKTTYFNRLLVKRFLDKNEKFCLFYRYNYELDDVSDKFFKDIQGLFFPSHEMTDKRRANGIYHELYLDDLSCGYAVSLNSSDAVKKNSHFFSDVHRIMFDEFQSETNHYCNDEITKFLSVYRSIARGKGKQMRYVPVYMVANPISIINPYYVSMGISARLRDDTKYLKGDGFVLEQGFVESALHAQEESGVFRAFKNEKYTAYSGQGVYLNDNKAFVERPSGRSRYLCTLKYNGGNYAIREYGEQGILYCDKRVDLDFPTRITVTTEDHQVNYVMLKRNDLIISNFRYLFERGCFRFKDLQCKEAVLCALSY